MKVADMTHGPEWVIWAVFALLAVISIILLTGRGSWLIAGYNTASNGERAKYDERKLCRTAGGGVAIIAIMILTLALLKDSLPASFVYIALGITMLDVAAIIALANTICRKK